MICYRPILAVIATFFAVERIFAAGTALPQVPSSSVCLLPNNLPAQPSIETWRQVRPILSAQLDQCLNNSDYFALYGASLLYTGDVARALEMLERALLINPSNGSARIDYAQALFQGGQLLAAIQVNNDILTESDIPPAIRNFLLERQAAWEERLHYWRNQVSYLYGYSNNLNNSTYIDVLTLTPPTLNIPVELPLSSSSLAQSGAYHSAILNTQYYTLKPDGAELWGLTTKTRESHLNKSDTDEFKLMYEREKEGLYSRNNWSSSVEHVRLGDESLYSAIEGQVRIYPNTQSSSPYLELETRYVSFNNKEELNEISYMARPGIAYITPFYRVGAELGFGVNNAVNDRPGGDRSQQEVSVFYDISVLGGRFASRVSYSNTHDKEGYNTWIDSNAKRKTQALSTTLQYFYPINEDWLVHGSYYYRDQESNISLFSTRTRSVEMGFTYRF